MRIAIFCHSLVSDWNHGNAHFLRGIASEMLARGHEVTFYEERDGWSLQNLVRDHGTRPLREFRQRYPGLRSVAYDFGEIDLDSALAGVDLVLVHEWNDPEMVWRIGEHRQSKRGTYRVLFHDTHHRCFTAPEEMAEFDLTGYDGVLAFGDRIRDYYLTEGLADRVWTWQEAADTRRFRPLQSAGEAEQLAWIGNWGDEERTEELHEFFIEPVAATETSATAYGVRYPGDGRQALEDAGITYRGWLPNYAVPETLGRHTFTIHVPRRPYVTLLPEIPTIRPFEALACGIPLISARWDDPDGLFLRDSFLVARDGHEMSQHMYELTRDREMRTELVRNGLKSIRRAHTCAHRVDELWDICEELEMDHSEQRNHVTSVNVEAAR